MSINIHEYLKSITPIEFEKLCGQLLSAIGYNIQYTKTTGDGGIDIRASLKPSLSKGISIIQCKRYSGNVGEPIIRDLYGVVMGERADNGILMTSGNFTESAYGFAKGKQITLVDGNTLVQLLEQYIFNSDYKSNEDSSIAAVLKKIDYYDDYIKLKEKYIKSNYSIKEGIRTSNFLYKIAVIYKFEDLFFHERKIIIQEIANILSNVSALRFEKQTKEDAYILFFANLLFAHSTFLLSEYDKTEEAFKRILTWNDLVKSVKLNNGLEQDFYNTIIQMCSFYSLRNRKDYARQWLNQAVIRDIHNNEIMCWVKRKQQEHPNLSYEEHIAYCQCKLIQINNIIDNPEYSVFPCYDIDAYLDDLLYDPIDSTFNTLWIINDVYNYATTGIYNIQFNKDDKVELWKWSTPTDSENYNESTVYQDTLNYYLKVSTNNGWCLERLL